MDFGKDFLPEEVVNLKNYFKLYFIYIIVIDNIKIICCLFQNMLNVEMLPVVY